jgi:hypothetical protein
VNRKPSKTTRGPNADEKRFQGWLKEQPCIWCENPGPSIVDHCRGATFKHKKTLIGHWFCLPQCVSCDTQKTIHGKRLGNESEHWDYVRMEYGDTTDRWPPQDVYEAIMDWNR